MAMHKHWLAGALLGLGMLASAAPAAAQGGGSEALAQAYKQEFSFLAAQRRELRERLEQYRERAASEARSARQRLEGLRAELAAVNQQQQQARQQLQNLQRQLRTRQDNRQIVDGTLSQADASLGEYGLSFLASEDQPAATPAEQANPQDEAGAADAQADTEGAAASRAEADAEENVAGGADAPGEPALAARITRMFEAGDTLIDRLASVRSESGTFFLPDGTEAEGTIVHFGGVASYGISDQRAGALAPAGGGRLKIWPSSDGYMARALQQGSLPPSLDIFLYESLAENVSPQSDETLLEHVDSGGPIGWIIIGLGGLAALLVLLRALFLLVAGGSAGRVESEVGDLVRQGKLPQAQERVARMRGSAARVVATAVRNLKRDRQHLEDLIAESILHESGRLNRFGAAILVIAAVAPLLGLLGTVTGMIATFEVITEHGTGDPKLLSGGISTALVTTELGLAVAIPTVILGNLLSSWAERVKDEMERAALRVSNLAVEPAEPKVAGA